MENNKELNDSSLEKVNGGADKNTDVNHNVTINGETVTVKGDQLIHLSFENQHLSELYTE